MRLIEDGNLVRFYPNNLIRLSLNFSVAANK